MNFATLRSTQRSNSPLRASQSPRNASPSPRPFAQAAGPVVRQRSRFEAQATGSNRDGGAGVIDRPKIDSDVVKKENTGRERPPIYKLLLHNDDFNRREYVVKILLKTVEGLTVEDAVNVMQEAHETGLALVTVCAQETAEEYCESLRLAGLISTVEPDSKPTGGSVNDN